MGWLLNNQITNTAADATGAVKYGNSKSAVFSGVFGGATVQVQQRKTNQAPWVNKGSGLTGLVTPTLTAHWKALAAVIAVAGTGYTANDVVTATGGTSGTTAQVTILTVNGSGVPLTISITRVGDYTVPPTGQISVTGGTGSGFKFTTTWALLSAAIASGGSMMPVGAILDLVGGTSTSASAVAVSTVSAGDVVTAVTVDTAGSYSVVPANAVVVTARSTNATSASLVLAQALDDGTQMVRAVVTGAGADTNLSGTFS